MSPEDKLLYRQIDEILWNDWDPIGVNETPEARDEYYGYIFDLLELKRRKVSMEEMANHLFRIETEDIGLFGNKENCERVAQKILALTN